MESLLFLTTNTLQFHDPWDFLGKTKISHWSKSMYEDDQKKFLGIQYVLDYGSFLRLILYYVISGYTNF